MGYCILHSLPFIDEGGGSGVGELKDSHFIGVNFNLCEHTAFQVRARFSVLDVNDRILCDVFEIGRDGPVELPGHVAFQRKVPSFGAGFTPTMLEKETSTRADGSIRVRAVVSIFLNTTNSSPST